jgi:pyruvate ferredoxin oxidoreductase gamma subunit
MLQIRIHGRAGQGVVTTAELIAVAAFSEGKFAQAFPFFGSERTGAPIEAYARIDEKPIRIREQIYEPDFLIIQDATLLNSIDLSKGCSKKTIAIINSNQKREEIDLKIIPKKNIYPVPATEIALEILGKNITNTVMLSTFAKISGLIKLAVLEEAIKEKFSEKGEKIVQKNIEAMRMAYTALVIPAQAGIQG